MDFPPSAELHHFVDERKIETHGISISKMRRAITLCVSVLGRRYCATSGDPPGIS